MTDNTHITIKLQVGNCFVERRLKVRYVPHIESDLIAYHNLDVKNELRSLVATMVLEELGLNQTTEKSVFREMIDELLTASFKESHPSFKESSL